MRINLFHNHYDKAHLEEVKAEMQKLGVPTIRAIWSEVYEEWLAVEGCHRIRAAADLGLVINIEDISDSETVIIQCDDEDTEVSVIELMEELQDEAWKKEGFTFGE